MHAQKIHQLSIKIGFIGLIKKTTKKTVTTTNVCSKKKTIKCSGSISIKDNEVISSNDRHNCIPLSDYEVTIEIRFNDLKASLCNSAVLDPCDLWKNFHKNLNLVDNIPSEFVDMLVEPWSKVKRQLQRIQKDAHNLP